MGIGLFEEDLSRREAVPGGERGAGEELEEGLVLVGAGGAEAGADLVEGRVGIAGVADEFPGLREVGGHGDEQGAEGFRNVEAAGGENADGAAGGGEAGGADSALEGSMLGLQSDDGEAAQAGGRSFGGAEGPVGLEGVADGGDLAGAGGGEKRAQDAGEEMRVFVRVDVGDAEACGLQTADLGRGFGDDFVGVNAEGDEVTDEVAQGVAQFAIEAD